MKYLSLVMAMLLVTACTEQERDVTKDHRTEQKHTGTTTHHMETKIPASLKAEHEELHRKLESYTKLPGKTGAAAKVVAEELHPHFMKEEEYALPPLGLLPDLAEGKISDEMRSVISQADKLKQEFQQMLEEHQQIVKALDKLNAAAKEENHPEVMQFVEALKLHAKTEEEVLYPTAILIGEYLKLKL